MVKFQFKDRRTGEPVLLSRVDDEIRQMLGLPPDPDEFCPEYTCLTSVGLSLTFHGEEITLGGLEAFDPPLGEELLKLAEEFLLRRYSFHSWR